MIIPTAYDVVTATAVAIDYPHHTALHHGTIIMIIIDAGIDLSPNQTLLVHHHTKDLLQEEHATQRLIIVVVIVMMMMKLMMLLYYHTKSISVISSIS